VWYKGVKNTSKKAKSRVDAHASATAQNADTGTGTGVARVASKQPEPLCMLVDSDKPDATQLGIMVPVPASSQNQTI
jgi:hypothetical protein